MFLRKNPRIDPKWAWTAYEPNSRQPWNQKLAGHLLRRAAFGGSAAEQKQALNDGPAATLDRLLAGGPDTSTFYRQADALAEPIGRGVDDAPLRAWWIYVLLHTPHPLREKMTLFWHNHFATSQAKVNDVAAMLGQNQLLRQHALGKFGPLLQDMSKDPAMLVWLDTVQNKKGKPNENYARELMELFSLGRGHYTEKDIREAARAFTGWSLKEGRFSFQKSQHDPGAKTVFGKTSKFGGEQIVELCLDRPEAARFLVVKLIRAFISDTLEPEPELVEALALPFRESDYDVSQLMRRLLSSNLFFSEHSYRARIKTPTEFAVGIVRGLEGNVSAVGLADALENLGQKLFFPPSVKGWDGGAAWLNTNTLLLRQNLAQALTSTEDSRFGRRCDPVALVAKYNLGRASDSQLVDFFAGLFLQNDLPAEARERLIEYRRESAAQAYPSYWTEQDVADHRLRTLCYLVLTQPEMQLD